MTPTPHLHLEVQLNTPSTAVRFRGKEEASPVEPLTLWKVCSGDCETQFMLLVALLLCKHQGFFIETEKKTRKTISLSCVGNHHLNDQILCLAKHQGAQLSGSSLSEVRARN